MKYTSTITKLLAPTGLAIGLTPLSACISTTGKPIQIVEPQTTITSPQPTTPPAPAAAANHRLPSELTTRFVNEYKKQPATLHKINHQGIAFHIVSFDTRDHELQVVDQANGPGSIWSSAKALSSKTNAVAAINAGFFTPEGKPLGLVIENGVKRGHFNSSSLGKGIYYTTATGAALKRSSHWRSILQTKPQHLLQSGPILVDQGITTRGLSTKSSRPRSFLATDGQNNWVIGHADSCTLSQLGKTLAGLEIQGFKLNTALNLDGGRSSDLYVNAEVTNGPLDIRPFWNKPVRNFLLLKKK